MTDLISLFSELKDSKDLTVHLSDLNYDLGTKNQWAYEWKMSFNFGPNKQTTKLLFSRKINSNHHSKLTFDSNQIRQYSSQKHFGLILDKKKNLIPTNILISVKK